jgi:hypothetical protein
MWCHHRSSQPAPLLFLQSWLLSGSGFAADSKHNNLRNQTRGCQKVIMSVTVSMFNTISFKRVLPSLVSLMSPTPRTSLCRCASQINANQI